MSQNPVRKIDNQANILGKNVSLSGSIFYENVLQIFGQVRGNIYSRGTLIVENDARIEGTIYAKEIFVHGKILGDIYVLEKSELYASASIEGNLYTYKVRIHDGTSFEGHCTTLDHEKLETHFHIIQEKMKQFPSLSKEREKFDSTQ